MLKKLLVSLTLFLSTLAMAEPTVVPQSLFNPEHPQHREAAGVLFQKCIPDCLVLDPKDWAKLKEQINQLIKEKVKQDVKNSV